MTRVAEQELQESIKKSEFRGMIATIASTVTVLVAIFFGGLQIVDVITYRVTSDVSLKMNKELSDLKKEQDLKDDIQNIRIDRLETTKQIYLNTKSN